jgi:hypothetical protein
MAKIQSPSGETEFFQITELQQAFEKELKSGERVSVAPGVIEASFLREAPVRAEYEMAFNDFKDKMLNPQEPFQPPVRKFRCTLSLRLVTLTIGTAQTLSTTTYGQSPILSFSTTYNPPPLPGRYPYIPGCNNDYSSVFSGPPINTYIFTGLPFQSFYNRTAPRETELIIPNYYTLTASLQDWSPTTQALGGISCSVVSIINESSGGGTNFVSGPIVSQNIPAGTSVPNIFNLVADLYVPGYDDPRPFKYGVNDACSYTLFNYRFTNNYP